MNNASADPISPYGRFEGKLRLEALDGNNRMKLLEDYTYIDPSEKRWLAPTGYESDGASIPRVAWTLVGDPWGPKYRNAAVVHDVACDKATEKWMDVHLAFYNAMRAAGVSPAKAKLMYAAVYHFGPRWTQTSGGVQRSAGPKLNKERLKVLKTEVTQINSTKKTEQSQLEDIRKMTF